MEIKMDKQEKGMMDVMEGSTEVVKGEVENFLVIALKTPVRFEGKNYDRIDLTRLQDITAADMIAVNRRMSRSGNVDITPELTLEYALNIANVVTGLPLEFFDQLPPYAAMAIKGRVTNFLYRQG